ncbi:MAG: GAF domain-containing protein, partial [Oligoflexia bacterium]|nr:GAF domain-containing protein [Oligoflexia bacterium]
LVPAEAGAALEREPDGRLRFLHAFGPRAKGVQGAVIPAGFGIAGFAVQRVASLLVTDTRSDERFCSDFDDITGFDTHAVICVPVAFERQIFGCLELLNPVLPGGFDRSQVQRVELVADALAGRLADRD